MSKPHLVPVLLLAAALAAVPAVAGPSGPRSDSRPRPAAVHILAQAWNAFVALWGANGCWMDPNGLCGSAAHVDNGCILDPNGRCQAAAATAPSAENGCSLDPDGRCKS